MIKKIFFIGLLLIALIGLPATIFLSQQTQDTRTKAATGSSFSLIPQGGTAGSIQKTVGDAVPIDLIIDPGPNQIGVLRVTIQYDPTKLELNAAEPFTPASKLSPPIIDPFFKSSGILTFALSVGTDPAKAIKTVEKGGTFNFKAIAKTDGITTPVIFIDETKAYSVGSSDEAAENVLGPKNPAQITIVAVSEPTATPTSSPTPTPTPTPTATPPANKAPTCKITLDKEPTGAAPFTLNFTVDLADSDGFIKSTHMVYGDGTAPVDVTDTTNANLSTSHLQFPYTYNNTGTYQFSFTVTDNQNTSATCTQSITVTGDSTTSTGSLQITAFLHSIGNSGDTANPTAHTYSNKSPKHQPRSFTVSIYNSDTTALVMTQPIDFTYNSAQGNYKGTLPLNSNFAEGDYTIKVKTYNFLQRKVPGFFHIASSSQLTLPVITLVAGNASDANGPNKNDIVDYNAIFSCYTQSPACDDAKKVQADLNDDGLVDEVDMNLFFREFTVQTGD